MLRVRHCVRARVCVRVRARACVCVRARVCGPRRCTGTLVAQLGPAVVIAQPRRAASHACICGCHRPFARVASGANWTVLFADGDLPWGVIGAAAGAIYGFDTSGKYLIVANSTDGGAGRTRSSTRVT